MNSVIDSVEINGPTVSAEYWQALRLPMSLARPAWLRKMEEPAEFARRILEGLRDGVAFPKSPVFDPAFMEGMPGRKEIENALAECDSGKWAKIRAGKRSLCDILAPATSRDDDRPALWGVHFSTDGAAIATDGRFLVSVPGHGGEWLGKTIATARVIDYQGRGSQKKACGIVAEKGSPIEYPSFPNYRQVIPSFRHENGKPVCAERLFNMVAAAEKVNAIFPGQNGWGVSVFAVESARPGNVKTALAILRECGETDIRWHDSRDSRLPIVISGGNGGFALIMGIALEKVRPGGRAPISLWPDFL